MIPILFAQVARAWSLGEVVVAIIILAAVVGVAVVATRAMNVPIPQWVWQIVGIVLIAVVAIVAIRFLLSL